MAATGAHPGPDSFGLTVWIAADDGPYGRGK